MRIRMVLMAIFLFTFSACNWFGNVEEGDKGTFTWKGQLVKDCNEEPMANEDIYIEIALNGLNQDGAQDTREIARTKTDNNGYFSITYEKIKSLRVMALALRLDDGTAFGQHILSGPINENVNRNIAKNSCNLFYLDFKNSSSHDSLYISFGKVIGGEYTISVSCEGAYEGCKQSLQAIPVGKSDFNELFKVQSQVDHSWNNKPIAYSYRAASTMKDIRKAIVANVIDSLPDDLFRYDYTFRGYPLVDTIHLEL